jgi:hypothetical protein
MRSLSSSVFAACLLICLDVIEKLVVLVCVIALF